MPSEEKTKIENEIIEVVGEGVEMLKYKEVRKYLKTQPELKKHHDDMGDDSIIRKLFDKFDEVKLKMIVIWTYSIRHLIILKSYMSNNFPEYEILEKMNLFVRIKLPTKYKLSQIFGKLNQDQEHLEIEEYNVKQMSLEQIFLTFADQKKE